MNGLMTGMDFPQAPVLTLSADLSCAGAALRFNGVATDPARAARSSMKQHEPQHWQGVEIAVTPGEEIQNWLARHGVCEPVRPRDMAHPEPPAGLWSTLNGGAVFAVITALIAMAWLLLFHVIPALTTVRLM